MTSPSGPLHRGGQTDYGTIPRDEPPQTSVVKEPSILDRIKALFSSKKT